MLSENDMALLLEKFNSRDQVAFGKLYSLFYSEFHHFACKVYRDTQVDADDVLNDIFVRIWQNRRLVFDKPESVKAYIYVSIRNQFKNHLSRNRSIEKYYSSMRWDADRTVAEVAESEVYSIVGHAMDLLPADCARVFRGLLEGWSVKEISRQLGMPERTVYSKKAEAINVLRGKLSKDHLAILLLMAGIVSQ